MRREKRDQDCTAAALCRREAAACTPHKSTSSQIANHVKVLWQLTVGSLLPLMGARQTGLVLLDTKTWRVSPS